MSHDVKLNFIRIDLTQKINSLHRLVGCSALLVTNRAMGLNLYFELFVELFHHFYIALCCCNISSSLRYVTILSL